MGLLPKSGQAILCHRELLKGAWRSREIKDLHGIASSHSLLAMTSSEDFFRGFNFYVE
jgi:hypothetical protein